MDKKPKILILYFDKPDRISILDLLYCYRNYSDADCFYYSMRRGKLPKYLLDVGFDLIVFHTVFISQRWSGYEGFKQEAYSLIEDLKDYPAVKILLPQDEWIHTDTLNDFINDFKIDIVYSVAPESEFGKIYDRVNREKVRFYQVLTGYLDDNTLSRISKLKEKHTKRNIDIGYRAYRAPFWLGSHGYLKTLIADVFNRESKRYSLNTDISTESKDTKYGDSWYEFLLDCKYFIGVEGGATVIDPNGEIWKKGEYYDAKYPHASFADFEKNCFPGMDGNLKLIAISPRHLEACSTGTCQLLIEGSYNGILKPGVHYISVARDFSNLDEVLQIVKDDHLRKEIVENCYRDIVVSEDYSYRKFVDFILETSLQGKIIKKAGAYSWFISGINILLEEQVNFFRRKKVVETLKPLTNSWRFVSYYAKVLPYTIGIKLGVSSLKEKRAKIKY